MMITLSMWVKRNDRKMISVQQLISDAVRCAQYRDEIDQKNDAIKELQLELETMKEEFAKVKKRNKQLAFIISQGESKQFNLPRNDCRIRAAHDFVNKKYQKIVLRTWHIFI